MVNALVRLVEDLGYAKCFMLLKRVNPIKGYGKKKASRRQSKIWEMNEVLSF